MRERVWGEGVQNLNSDLRHGCYLLCHVNLSFCGNKRHPMRIVYVHRVSGFCVFRLSLLDYEFVKLGPTLLILKEEEHQFKLPIPCTLVDTSSFEFFKGVVFQSVSDRVFYSE